MMETEHTTSSQGANVYHARLYISPLGQMSLSGGIKQKRILCMEE